MSNAEAALASAVFVGYAVKGPVHRALAALDLAPDPDPVAHDVRTVAFLEALDLDPVAVLGVDVVAQTEAWSPETSPASDWVPFRARFARASRSLRPSGSHSRLAIQ